MCILSSGFQAATTNVAMLFLYQKILKQQQFLKTGTTLGNLVFSRSLHIMLIFLYTSFDITIYL